MAEYFSFFPKTIYAQELEQSSVDVVTNLISRFAFEKKLKENTSVFEKYDIRDGDTPESIAYKLYGSSEKHWVILSLNDIIDPQFDFPLDQITLGSFIDSKYTANANTGQSGLMWAQSNIHSYYKVEKRTTLSTGDFKEDIIEVDANTYANISATTSTVTVPNGKQVEIKVSKNTKSYYEYETEHNERNRTINLLKPEFVSTLTDELKTVLGFR